MQAERILTLAAAKLDATLHELRVALALDGLSFSTCALSRLFQRRKTMLKKRPCMAASRSDRMREKTSRLV